MTSLAQGVMGQVRDRYLARTPNSLRLHEEAKKWLPGGDTRTINHYTPYPTFMAHGAGCVLTDADGNEYLDFCNNMSAIVHGHAHPALVAAAHEQIHAGTALGTPSEIQLRHARMICDRVTSVEKLRYCNSGTEATMLTLRAARAFTGRDAIVKIDGGYHGIHNDLEVNMFAGMREPTHPQPGLPDTFPRRQVPRGTPANVGDEVFVLPYNDLAAAAELLDVHGRRIAALIVEPMMGAAGGIPGEPDYLRGLRRLTEKHDVLLIFDECATFRVGPLQERYGIHPDLTSLSKIIGGGLPIGAFGGRADVMTVFDPTQPDPVYHASAFGGNNLSLRVGLAALQTYGPDEVAWLNGLGESLINRLPEVGAASGVRLRVTGIGSLAYLHWGDGPIRNARQAFALRSRLAEFPELIHLELMNRGIYLARNGLLALSLPMTDEHVRSFLDRMGESLLALRPYLAERLPHLLAAERMAPTGAET